MSASSEEIKNKALATIDSALTILTKFPELSNTSTNLSTNASTDPISFLMDAFKHTMGYNVLLEYISKFICTELPVVEVAVKGILLTNIKNLLNCSINPFITNELLRDGISFDLRRLDLLNMLRYSPLDPKIGHNYYFGYSDAFGIQRYDPAEIFETPDDLLYSNDMNCWLWYLKNKGVTREVWGQYDRSDHSRDDKKQKKRDGIITLEYHESGMSMHNADYSGNVPQQTPYMNCLHVFIGNTKEKYNGEYESAKTRTNDLDKTLKQLQSEMYNLKLDLENIYKNFEILEKSYTKDNMAKEKYESEFERLTNERVDLEKEIFDKEQEINDTSNQRDAEYALMRQAVDAFTTDSFRPINQNYYYHRTVIEFNTDYIMSLKLFDARVVAAQLLDALTGCLNISLSLSYEQQIVQYEIMRMVQDMVKNDDTVVSDCFFSFANDDYDAMLKKSEMVRNGLFTINGEHNSTVKMDAESIMNSLNSINGAASEEEMLTTIQGALQDISKSVSETHIGEDGGKWNFGIQMNFIENILNNLAFILVQSILSPKVYLLIAINLKILGRSTNFNLDEFIDGHKQLVAKIIRQIRDSLLSYLINSLRNKLDEIAENVAVRIAVEQMKYYTDLIKRLIECFRLHSGELEFNIDNVNYADIYQQESDGPKNKEC